jgi:hypothetical protein
MFFCAERSIHERSLGANALRGWPHEVQVAQLHGDKPPMTPRERASIPVASRVIATHAGSPHPGPPPRATAYASSNACHDRVPVSQRVIRRLPLRSYTRARNRSVPMAPSPVKWPAK